MTTEQHTNGDVIDSDEGVTSVIYIKEEAVAKLFEGADALKRHMHRKARLQMAEPEHFSGYLANIYSGDGIIINIFTEFKDNKRVYKLMSLPDCTGNAIAFMKDVCRSLTEKETKFKAT
jgi:hypothetical protein